MPANSSPCFPARGAEVDVVLASRLVDTPTVLIADDALTGRVGTVRTPRLL